MMMVANAQPTKGRERTTLTTGDIARHCDVNFRTVIRWIKRGYLKAYQLPGRGDNRVEVADFVAFLSSRGMKVPPELADTRPGGKTGKPRVLIVDNEKALVTMVAQILESAGYEVEVAFDGFQAGFFLNVFQPDLMTLDLAMPGMDGMQVLKFVRDSGNLPQLRILVISAMGEDALAQAMAAGANDRLAKPFNKAELLARVDRLVKAPAAEERLAVNG